MSLFIDPKYDDLYKYNQETNSDNEIAKIKEFTRKVKRAISKA